MCCGSPKVRWKAEVAYDGADFNGWQSQVDGNTVQDFLEKRLAVIFKEPVRIHGSGRTDSGVHATGQVFHFDAEWPYPVGDLIKALRGSLPDTIRLIALAKAAEDFHARYSVVRKRYCYRIYEGYAPPFETRYCWSLHHRRLDVDAMSRAAEVLLGKHDFSAFAATRDNGNTENPVKELFRLEVEKNGSRLQIIVEADGFLYKMVRSLVGALVDVGLARLTAGDIAAILESKQRTGRVVTAPARGLTLDQVFY